jgi:uncharacterized membrane protein YhaH (DUF805 family)
LADFSACAPRDWPDVLFDAMAWHCFAGDPRLTAHLIKFIGVAEKRQVAGLQAVWLLAAALVMLKAIVSRFHDIGWPGWAIESGGLF